MSRVMLRRVAIAGAAGTPALVAVALAAGSATELALADATCVTALVAALRPELVGWATILLLATAPFSAVTIGGYAIPLVLALAPIAAAVAWSTRLRCRAAEPLSREARLTLAAGGALAAAGTLSYAITAGSNGSADTLEYLKWIAAASLVVVPIGYGAAWCRTAARVFSVGTAAGGIFALATVAGPGGPQLLDALGRLGYVRTVDDSRYFLLGGTEQSLRAAGSYTDPNIAALFFVLGLAASVLVRRRRLRLPLQLVLAAALLATLSRGALLGAGVALAAVVVAGRMRASHRVLAGTLLVAGVVTVLAVPIVNQRVLTSLSTGDIGTQARASALSSFGDVMSGHWETGFGFGRPEFRDSAAAYSVNVVADAPLAAVYRGGLVAGAGFAAWYLWSVTLGLRRLRERSGVSRVIGAALLALCVTALTGYSTALNPEVVALFALWVPLTAECLGTLPAHPPSRSTMTTPHGGPPMHRLHPTARPPARVAAAGLIATAAVLATPAVAGAYPSPGATATLHANCHAIFEGSNPDCQLRFRLRDAGGHPVSGAAVTWSVTGIAGATVQPVGSGTGPGGQAQAVLVPGPGNCERTATITATAQGVSAQTQVEIECLSDRRGRHLPPPGLFRSILRSVLVDLGGGTLTWSQGGHTVTVSVPAGALPEGTEVSVVGADDSRLTSLLHHGDVLVDSFAVEWTGAQAATAPISVAVDNAAARPGQQVFEVTTGGLVPVPGASVQNGRVTLSTTEDPAFVVVSPATPVNQLSSGTATLDSSSPSRFAVEAGGVVIALCLGLALTLRRRRQGATSRF